MYLYGYDDSGGRVSLAWFRRNKLRLHPSHDFVAGPSRSRGHGRPRHPNLPYRHFRAYTISQIRFLFDYQKNSYILCYIFNREDGSDCGGVSTRGHGKREGPDGDKWSKTTQETLGGSGVSEANGVLRKHYHPPGATIYI